MWAVPIDGDNITTADNLDFTVIGFTNLKSKGPAVYVESETESKAPPVYFFDIKKVNGVEVDFPSTSKILNAVGFLKRKIHLPQKHDVILVNGKEVKVKELKLHNKNLGLSRGLVIIDEDGDKYSLTDIEDIQRVRGDSFFDKKKFQKIYMDYLGYTNGKH
jgi:hypothetical protein